MEAYSSFAKVYDELMDNIPYESWCKYLSELLKRYSVDSGLVLDMGCGTGNITQRLAESGYDMIGIDNSLEMLMIARDKDKSKEILYLLQDMRSFELYGTVRAVVSICDSMNYILEEEELLMVFKGVNNYLDPGGVFIFDMNTVYKYQELLGENTIAESRENCCFIWDNYFYEDEQVNEYELSLFIKEEGDMFRRFRETHFQKAYSVETVKALLIKGGLEFVAVYDAFTWDPPSEDSERIYFVAREKGKEVK